MNMKKIIGIALVLFTLLVSGIYYAREQEWSMKKVVLQENVHADLINEKQINVKVEEVGLKLAEGEYFSPAFYVGEEIYGDIDIGISVLQSLEKFPVGGSLKQYLYQLEKDNTLKETSKKVFAHVYLSKMIAYEDNHGVNSEVRKLYAIDYLKEDEPTEMNELDELIKTTGTIGYNTFMSEIVIDEDTTYIQITSYLPDKGWVLYFYDVQKNRLYKRTGDVLNQTNPIYINALKSFVWIDKDFKCYKVVFTEDEYDYVEYLDLKPYLKASFDTTSKEKTLFISSSDEEIIIETQIPFREDGYFKYHPTYKTKSLSTFNFKTNQFQELFLAKEGQNINVNYSGSIDAAGGKLLIIDEFEDDNGFISPKERFFKAIVNDELYTIYKEDIRGEGKTLSPFIRAIVREDGKEIFLEKHITVMEDNIETTKDVVYKRYTFE
jgi:hypothetical protein